MAMLVMVFSSTVTPGAVQPPSDSAPDRISVRMFSPAPRCPPKGRIAPPGAEIGRIGGRQPGLGDDDARPDGLALVLRHQQLALGGHGGGDVEQDRVAALDRHADRHRARRQPPVAAAERRPHQPEAGGVQEVQRDQGRARPAASAPVAQPAEMG